MLKSIIGDATAVPVRTRIPLRSDARKPPLRETAPALELLRDRLEKDMGYLRSHISVWLHLKQRLCHDSSSRTLVAVMLCEIKA
jgi:hypothetical protein